MIRIICPGCKKEINTETINCPHCDRKITGTDNLSLIKTGPIVEIWSNKGKIVKYEIDIFHEGLHKYKTIRSNDKTNALTKAGLEASKWANEWLRYKEKEQKDEKKRRDKEQEEQLKMGKDVKEKQAQEMSEDAENKLLEIERILEYTLSVNDAVDWESAKIKKPFMGNILKNKHILYRKEDGFPTEFSPFGGKLIAKPFKDDFFYKIPFYKFLLGQKKRILEEQEQKYREAFVEWEKAERENNTRKEILVEQQGQWQKAQEEAGTFNKKMDQLKELYKVKDPEAIVEYCEIVLNNSEYPEDFPKNFEIQYNQNNGSLIINYDLPTLKDIPKLRSVIYVKSKDIIKEKYLSEKDHEKLFDSCIYQIVLRTLHEIFEADAINAITLATINGIITDINPATGHIESKCILSIQVNKDEFEKINLSQIDPKSCFKKLKGVGSSKLSSLSPIQPILELDKSDRRFVDHYNLVDGLDPSSNLAAMDWQDFENLIREIFEKEFGQHGGEVKVTQGAKDGGIDAVAFDLDPIRGGKIVIQAKRYTNTVGVAAVRDLYGTVMNEGANKGILVTTSDYGPDAYAFAKDKPLTLLNGSNLLHLLGKHGHRAIIDLNMAKTFFKGEKEK